MPLLETLVDTFGAGTLGAVWAANGAGVQDGQLYVNASQAAGSPVFSSARSSGGGAGYTFTGSSLTVELKAVPGIAGNTVNGQVWVMDPAPAATVDRVGFEYVGSANRLDFLGQTGAGFAAIGTTASVTYDPVAHRWLRISHSGTAITWQTSPTGLVWTTQRTMTTGIPTWMAKTTLIASFEAFRTTGTNDTMRVDNVNSPPAALPTSAPVGSDALQRRTLTELRAWKAWLTTAGAAGFVGEFNGVTTARGYGQTAEGALWEALLDVYLTDLDYQGLHSAAWGSGREFDSGYPLAVHVPTATGGGALAVAVQNASTVLANHPTRGSRWRSVNLAGHEHGINIAGGGTVRSTGPYVHTAADFGFLAANGVDTVRLPVAWERLQPTLSTALDTTALGVLDGMLTAARQAGIRVILDLHNYGRYTQANGTTVVALGGTLTNAQFSDFWTRMSTWVRADTSRSGTVIAYALMNEPHDLTGGASTWQTASQAVVTAIRGGGDNRLLFVGGYSWSSLTDWPTVHAGGNWITDSAANFSYEAHHYWDTQSALGSRSGTYQQSPTGPIETYAIELAAAQASDTGGGRTNSILNPSWETGTGRWNYTAPSGTITTGTPSTAAGQGPQSGQLYGFVSRTTAGRISVVPNYWVAVTAGKSYAASVYVNRDGTGTGTLDIDWYSGANGVGYLSSSTATLNPAAATWGRISVIGTAPAGAAFARMFLHFDAMLAANNLRFDAALFEQSASLQAFFDGSYPGSWWTGTIGDSTSVRGDDDVVWKADLSQATHVAGGFIDDPYQRVNGAGTQNDPTVPWPIIPVTSPGGRPDRSLPITVPANYQRYETKPNHVAFDGGHSAYCGLAFYLDDGFPTNPVPGDYQIIEELRQASAVGGSVVSFEVIGGELRLTGGYGVDAATPTRLQYFATLVAGVQTKRWYNLVYRIGVFSLAENTTTIDVWVDGVRLLTNYTIKPPTVIGGTTTRRQGIAHDQRIAAGTIYQSGQRLGRTYTAADPSQVLSTMRAGQGVAAIRLYPTGTAGKKTSAGGGSYGLRLSPTGAGAKSSAGTAWATTIIPAARAAGVKVGIGDGRSAIIELSATGTVPPPVPIFTGRPLPEDPLPLASARYLVQNIMTGEWLHQDLPLAQDTVTLKLSGPCEISGKISPEMADLKTKSVQLITVPVTVPTTVATTVGTDPAVVLSSHGIGNTDAIIQAAEIVGMDLAHAVAMVEKESGGRMVWGHDAVDTKGYYVKGAPVTPANYHPWRDAIGRANAATAILARINANLSMFEDLTWGGAPQVVFDYNDQLLARYTGNTTAALKAFLQTQIDGKPGYQGIGITQLTYFAYLDQADALHADGPADAVTNGRVGFAALKGLQTTYGDQQGARRYNGSGTAAEAYGADYMVKLGIWQQRLAATTTTYATSSTTTYKTETIVTEVPLLRSWGHVLYLELDGEIRAAGMLTEESYDDQTQSLTCKGVSDYPAAIAFQGQYRRYFANPLDVVSDMWAYVQSFSNGNLGVAVSRLGDRPSVLYGATVNPVPGDKLLGLPYAPAPTTGDTNDPPKIPVRAANTIAAVYNALIGMGYTTRTLADTTKPASMDNSVPADTIFVRKTDLERAYRDYFILPGTAQNYADPPDQTSSVTIDPYKVDWWDVKNCGELISTAIKACPADYVEQYAWNFPRTFVEQTVALAYPRLGRGRDDLRFVQGENIVSAPELAGDPDDYATAVIGIGAGEGSAALRETAETIVLGRVRKTYVYRNATIGDRAMLARIVRDELVQRSTDGHEISKITVLAAHDNAPFGSYNVGDDILVQVLIPHYGWVTQWGRILQLSLARGAGLVELTLRRSDSFFYGRETEATS